MDHHTKLHWNQVVVSEMKQKWHDILL